MVPIYNNIDEIIVFEHHWQLLYLIPNTTLLVNILTNIFPISTSFLFLFSNIQKVDAQPIAERNLVWNELTEQWNEDFR